MINAVSERIRHIIKSQDQTPQSQLYRSRDNSLDSNHSAGNSKTITNNNYPPIPPRSPSKKTRSHIHKSQINQIQQQIQQIQSIDNDQNQLIQKIKNKVMEFLFPFLEQISQKIQNLSKKVNNVQQSVKNNNRSQQKWKEIQKWVTQVFMKIQTDLNNFQSKKLLSIQAQIAKIKNQHNAFTKKLDKITAETHVNQFLQYISPKQNTNTFSSKQSQQLSSLPLSISPQLTNPKLNTNQLLYKCKCEKLISQILQSQNHLMMELKYIKHFQDSTNNTQHQKDYQRKTFRKEYR